jgi:1-deoxy-D-xylulose-5-phosphate synthase
MLQAGTTAAEELGATVVDMRFVKPLDTDCVLELADSHQLLVTVEENSLMGGAGSAVNECLAAEGHQVEICNIGIPDNYIQHASREECLAEVGLDAEGVLRQIRARLDPAGTTTTFHPKVI